jgi:peptidoglycan/xylan/chitin deacetylase (PgdA/CDA1 family)
VALSKDPKELAEKLRKYIERDTENIILVLHKIGQEAVNWARENGSYTDRTGNLRNSIGYIIFQNGEEIDSFGNAPAQANKDTVIRLAQSKIPKSGLALVVFAGMEYGIYVEARGYTVLSGALENSITAKALGHALKKVKE